MTQLKDALALTPWKHLEGILIPDPAGPTLETFRGNLRGFSMAATEKLSYLFTIPHDWILDSTSHLYLRWGHNGTAIAADPNDRNLVDIDVSYVARNGAVPFAALPAEASGVFDDASMTLTNYPQYCQAFTEVELANNGGTGGALLDCAAWETDGLILATITQNTIPTITGGTTEPFIFSLGMKYKSDGSGTLNKDPDYDA